MKSAMLVLAVCAVGAINLRPAAAQTVASETAAAQSDGEECLLDDACCPPQWTVTAGSITLHRSRARGESLVFEGAADRELSNVRDFDLGWAGGPQIELTRHFDCGCELAARYFSIDGWSASRTLADAGNLRVPLVSDDPDDFFDTAHAGYASRLYSTELNLQRPLGERLHFLAGFRWVELHEAISAGAFSPGLEGTFDFRTANHLYGFQIGTEGALWAAGPLTLDGFLKAGVYGNAIGVQAEGHGTEFDLEGSGSRGRTSFLGELGLLAKYRFAEHWTASAGYEAMWIDGVSLAADSVAALAQSDDDRLLNGSTFYHGLLVGLELAW